MWRKFGDCWVEYRYPMVLMDRPPNMEIGLCRYQKGANNKWTNDFTDHFMVDLETIIALATMTYNGASNVYELHPGDEKKFNDFADESWDILLYIL